MLIVGNTYPVSHLPIGSEYCHIAEGFSEYKFTISSVDSYGVNCTDGSCCHGKTMVILTKLPNIPNRWNDLDL